MSTSQLNAALGAFDDVSRGDPAPSWARAEIVRAWGLPGDAVVTLVVLSENVTFKIVVDGAPALVVRLCRPGYAASTEHVRGELSWIEALRRDAGIPTPAPVPGADGDLVQSLTDDTGGVWTAVAFSFVEGTVLEDAPPTAVVAQLEGLGRLTALMHGHARAWVPPRAFERFEWDIRDMVGSASRWGDWRGAALSTTETTLLERAERTARRCLSDLGVDRSPPHFGLIHADLRPSNVMLTAGPDPLVVIDFDDCGFGYYLYDFAAALTFYEHRDEAREMAARWLDGYGSVRALSRDERRAASALSMLRRLTMLGWSTTHRADALPPDLWEENLPGTVEVAHRFLQDPEWIVRG